MTSNPDTHILSRELATFLGNGRHVANRAEILAGLLRYATRKELIAEDLTLIPDQLLSELLGSTDPLHVKDLFSSIRQHIRRPVLLH